MTGKFNEGMGAPEIKIPDKDMPHTKMDSSSIPSLDDMKRKFDEIFQKDFPQSEEKKWEQTERPKDTGRIILDDGTVVELPSQKSVEESHVERESSDSSDNVEKKGGSYRDVKVDGEGDKYEVHHMPADSASNLERDDGPAIKMDKEDHRQTASCGMSQEAREYREKQRELIAEGKFKEALQMDIDDIHEKFGDKYDDAIAEMLEYVDQLEAEEKI